MVAAAGYLVQQNPTKQEVAEARRNTGDTGDPEKSPDYLIEGHVFDCYAPEAETSVRGVWTAAGKKVIRGQSQRVVLNLADWGGKLADLQKQFDTWPGPGLKEVVALTGNGAMVEILRRN
ncbi:hypothetical protein AB0I61_28420 [Polymorphospora rubra]|uniref:CdiA C-terminal domain-containing protein n=1 Tax=Polymorphospora rubra TaxID=338584 RepID=UPI00341007A3